MIVGIVGSIGAGKSTVIEILRDQGFQCVEADDLVLRLFSYNYEVRAWLKENVGAVFNESGEVDRDELRKKLTPALRECLDSLIVPRIWNAVKYHEREDGIVFFSSARMQNFVPDKLVYVRVSSRREQIERAVKRGTRLEIVNQILSVQKETDELILKADWIINNDSSYQCLIKQVDVLCQHLAELGMDPGTED